MVSKESLILGGVLAGIGVAGVAAFAHGRTETRRLPYNPYRYRYRRDLRQRGEFTFTYYYDKYKGSFNKIGNYHTAELRRRKLLYKAYPLHDYLIDRTHRVTYDQNNFAVLHPLFSAWWGAKPKFEVLDVLEKSHRYIVGFDLADTDRISESYVRFANDDRVDGIFVPSTFNLQVYRNSGVINRVYVCPHGLDPLYSKPMKEYETGNRDLRRLRQDDRVKILTFLLHSGFRKGSDVMEEALKRLRVKGRDFLFVVKTQPSTAPFLRFEGFPTYVIPDWLGEEDLIYLYDSCDVYLSPCRGGGFELNPLEAMARGLPVIITGWGSWMDYANLHNTYLIAPKGLVKIFPMAREGHVGMGADPDVDHCVELLEWVMDNLEYAKRKAGMERLAVVEKYSWERTVEAFLEGCREIYESS